MDGTKRITAFLGLMVAVLGWSASPVMIRFLSDAYDPYTQAFVRYFIGSTALVAISQRSHSRPTPDENDRDLRDYPGLPLFP